MTAIPGRVSGSSSYPALSRLVAQPTEFAQAWGVKPVLTKAAELPSREVVLDSCGVDELLSTRGMRTPFVRVAKGGVTANSSQFTAGGGVGATIADQISDDKLFSLFRDGSTIVLQGLHRTWSPIIELAQQLSADLGHPTQANAYVTPPQNKGFSAHYDVHDVFVLQCSGRKRWIIHEPVLEAPLRDQEWANRASAVATRAEQKPYLDVVLEPGDSLYLPRGWIHAASALGEVSIHITLGVQAEHRHTVASELATAALARLGQSREARNSLPLAGEPMDEDLAEARRLLHEAIDQISDQTLAEELLARRRRSQRAAPLGPLAQLDALTNLHSDTHVMLRPHLVATLEDTMLGTRLGRWTLKPDDLPFVQRLIAGEHLSVAQLGTDLATRLLRAGLVTAES